MSLGITLTVAVAAVAAGTDPLIAFEQAKLSSNGQESFGVSVAVSGDTAAVGSESEFSTVKVFVRSQGIWVEQQVLTASEGPPWGGFGKSIALGGDTLVVGAPGDDLAGVGAGAVYVFVRNGTTWSEQQILRGSDTRLRDSFGASVAISGDTLAVGATSDGRGYLLADVGGLAWDAALGWLYGTDTNRDDLAQIDPATGEAAVVNPDYKHVEANGLEFVPATNTLYGADNDMLVVIDTATGEVSPVGPFGFSQVRSLAYDPSAGILYGADTLSDRLITIDPLTGAGTAVGFLGFGYVSGMAFDPNAGILYGSDAFSDKLVRIDPATGKGTAIGPFGFENVHGLAFDPAMGTLYGTTGGTVPGAAGRLLTIDTSTGAASVVGSFSRLGRAYAFAPTAAGWMEQAILTASDGAQPDLFGTSVAASGDRVVVGSLADSYFAMVHAGSAYVFERNDTAWTAQYKLKPSDATQLDNFGAAVAMSGDTILVGAPRNDHSGFMDAGAAYAFVPNEAIWVEEARLIASDPSQSRLFGQSVSVSNELALVASFGTPPGGLSAAHLFLRAPAGWSFQTELHASDPEPFGWSVAISGPTAVASGFPANNAYVFGITTAPPVTYCTAGTSASGCQASISSAGAPSSTAPSGFFLKADRVEGQKDGLFYLGTNGRRAVPWGNGTSFQCVVPPLQRAGPLSGTGTDGECDGAFSQDLNAFWCPECPEPQTNPGVGTAVQAQLWYRDPLNTSNQRTSLSDAIEFAVGP